MGRIRTHCCLSLRPILTCKRKRALVYWGGKSLDFLRKYLNIGSYRHRTYIIEHDEDKLIYQDAQRNYMLTNMRKIITRISTNCMDAVETLNKFKSF